MSLDPSTTPSERTNEEAQSKIWSGFCQETGLIDFLCVFVPLVHFNMQDRKRTREKVGEKREAIRGHPLRLQPNRGEFLQTLRVSSQSISTDWDSSGENTCTAPHCSACMLACLPACLPDCSNIWQRSKWIQKEHLHSSKQPSKQTLLMKVVTVPKHKATLLTTYFLLIKNILSIGTVFFPVYLRALQQFRRLVSVAVWYVTHTVQGYAVIYCNIFLLLQRKVN